MMDKELKSAVEIIKGRLYFQSVRRIPRVLNGSQQTTNKAQSFSTFVTVDDKYLYEPFFEDFGPLNLGQTFLFCKLINDKLDNPENENQRVYVLTSLDGQKKANAALLVCAYMLICHKQTPEEAYRPFLNYYPPFVPFRDASQSISTYNLTILDCLRGISKAMLYKFFDYKIFDVEEYLYYEKVENGDMNWIIPNKVLGFKSPTNIKMQQYGIIQLAPEDYIPIFQKWNVSAIIRLNKKIYDRKKFFHNGINHYDLYFEDGGVPSDSILRKFFDILEREPGAIAVHCKAGLGRTGTCIGCYLMKYYRFTAAEAIAWLRVCRPGSVIGIQQHFLHDMQAKMWKVGEKYWKSNYEKISQSPIFSSELKPLISHANLSDPKFTELQQNGKNDFFATQKESHIQHKKIGSQRVNFSKDREGGANPFEQKPVPGKPSIPNESTSYRKQRPVTTAGLSRTIPLISTTHKSQITSPSSFHTNGLASNAIFRSSAPSNPLPTGGTSGSQKQYRKLSPAYSKSTISNASMFGSPSNYSNSCSFPAKSNLLTPLCVTRGSPTKTNGRTYQGRDFPKKKIPPYTGVYKNYFSTM